MTSFLQLFFIKPLKSIPLQNLIHTEDTSPSCTCN